MKLYILFVLTCLSCLGQAQTIKYVKSNASSNGDGSTWQNAFLSLQPALQSANYGDQIWVAQGTYLPTDGTDREAFFLLPNGVSIWGGFAGTELALAQRNPATNPTILSGDIGVPNLRDDNVYHIVVIQGGDTLSIVDGFTVIKGNANASLNGETIPHNQGGGILVLADELNPVVTPVIRNCRFEQNRAERGGAIACLGSSQYVSTPAISSCVFVKNRGEELGASIYKEGVNRGRKPFKVENCLFERNFCRLVSGGIVVNNSSGIVQLRGCTFRYDTGMTEVGAVYFATGDKKIRYEIDSCDFTGNYSSSGTGGVKQIVLGNFLDTVRLVINKSRFLGNHNYIGDAGGVKSYAYSDYHGIFFKDCVFDSNASRNGAGGIYIEDDANTSSEINVDRCFFWSNLNGFGTIAGAFYYRGFGSSLIKNQTTITNSVFMYNGGSIASIGTNPSIINTRVVNCSFYSNGENPFAKAWTVQHNPVDFISKMQILNCVIWEPQVDSVKRVFYNNNPVDFSVNDYQVEHSLIHLADCTYNGVDPCGEGMIYEKWPEFLSVDAFTLINLPYGPGVNKGSSLVADTFGLTRDYEQQYRICDTAVDMGAYEIQVNCTVGTSTPDFTALPLNIKILRNPVQSGTPIMAQLSTTAAALNLRLLLTDIQGHIVWQNRKFAPTYFPDIFSIDAGNLQPGIYLLHIMDESGRAKVVKVVIL